MKEISVNKLFMFWIFCENHIKNNPSQGKDIVKLKMSKLTGKLGNIDILNIHLIEITHLSYTLEFEFEGLQIVKKFQKSLVDSIDIEQIYSI